MNRIGGVVVREIREALPAIIFFLFLFHLIALTKAVTLENYSVTALRATTSTVGALIVAKAIVLVEALPIARFFSSRPLVQVIWKTLLFAVVTLLFRFVEEIIPLISKYGGVVAATTSLVDEISWPLFWVLALWILSGLFLYTLATELVRAAGPQEVRKMLLSKRGNEAP